MKQLLNRKLRSQEGASIMMALLVFLVCSILAGVILAAATSAAGRVSGLAEADQKYYAVNSAADVFREMMGGDEGVSVEIACEKQTVTKRKNGSTIETTQKPATCNIDGTPIESGSESLPALTEKAALIMLLAGKNASESVGDYAWSWVPGSIPAGKLPAAQNLKFSYPSAPVSSKGAALLNNVTIEQSLNENGDIVVRFASDSTPQAYSVELTCKADYDTKATSSNTSETASGTTTITRTDSKVTTITWKASELKQAAAPAGAQAGGGGN